MFHPDAGNSRPPLSPRCHRAHVRRRRQDIGAVRRRPDVSSARCTTRRCERLGQRRQLRLVEPHDAITPTVDARHPRAAAAGSVGHPVVLRTREVGQAGQRAGHRRIEVPLAGTAAARGARDYADSTGPRWWRPRATSRRAPASSCRNSARVTSSSGRMRRVARGAMPPSPREPAAAQQCAAGPFRPDRPACAQWRRRRRRVLVATSSRNARRASAPHLDRLLASRARAGTSTRAADERRRRAARPARAELLRLRLRRAESGD